MENNKKTSTANKTNVKPAPGTATKKADTKSAAVTKTKKPADVAQKNISKKILDDKNIDNIILYDETNKPTEFSQECVVTIDEHIYVLLKPITKIEGVKEDEIIAFLLTEDEEGEDMLVIVTDDALLDEIYEEYKKAYDENI